MSALADWVSAIGSIGAAWVAVGALLYDRHLKRKEDDRISRDVHAWVRWVDDDPDIDDSWILHLSNGSGGPIQSWIVEFTSGETLGSGDLGPLPPGTLRRRVEPVASSLGETPRVSSVTFRVATRVFQRSGHDAVQQLPEWPAQAIGDDVVNG